MNSLGKRHRYSTRKTSYKVVALDVELINKIHKRKY